MAFFQAPPALDENQFEADRALRATLRRLLSPSHYQAAAPHLARMGGIACDMHKLQAEDRENLPRLTQWDAWGNRVDTIELTATWRRAAVVAAEEGLIATAFEGSYGDQARLVQFALIYLFDGSSDVYTCPLAMTDGAATTLQHHRRGSDAVLDRAFRRMTHRDPIEAWTSGQWMTERTGGSDVGKSETVARVATTEEAALFGAESAYLLSGTKWFTSAATSQIALTLARIEGDAAGGRGLTLFYVECRRPDGRSNGIRVNRLKDKLGTKKLPTAELTLDDTIAIPVAGAGNGIRHISPMLNVTRTWNAVCSVAAMRRGIALARDYAKKREQFGAPLAQKPLHLETLAALQTTLEASLQLAFRTVSLLGRATSNTATDDERALLRLLTPLTKLLTAKQCVASLSEVIECFGGAGYVEDTGLPRLLRDAQVLPIWEGTTNVLSLDFVRATGKELSLAPIVCELDRIAANTSSTHHQALVEKARAIVDRAQLWLRETGKTAPLEVEAGARRLALTVGHALELALLAEHAAWTRTTDGDDLATLAADRFSRRRLDELDAAAPPSISTKSLAMS